jgi:hypothetical protein
MGKCKYTPTRRCGVVRCAAVYTHFLLVQLRSYPEFLAAFRSQRIAVADKMADINMESAHSSDADLWGLDAKVSSSKG